MTTAIAMERGLHHLLSLTSSPSPDPMGLGWIYTISPLWTHHQRQQNIYNTERGREMKQAQVMEKGWSEIRTALKELPLLNYQGKEISTLAFLRLSNLLVLVLDKVGPTMTVLRQDIQQNIERIEEVYVSDPSVYFSLGEILQKEMGEETSRKPGSCSKAVLWLTRSICFGLEVLRRLVLDANLSMEQVVEEAYKSTLQPWHGWISSAAYKVALKLIPERDIFISFIISQGQDYEGLKGDIQKLASLLQPFLDEIHELLRTFRLDRLKST